MTSCCRPPSETTLSFFRGARGRSRRPRPGLDRERVQIPPVGPRHEHYRLPGGADAGSLPRPTSRWLPGDTVRCNYVNVKTGRGDRHQEDDRTAAITRVLLYIDCRWATSDIDHGGEVLARPAQSTASPVPGRAPLQVKKEMTELTGLAVDQLRPFYHGTPGAAIVVDPGETVTCTFTNTKEVDISVEQV